MERSSTSAALTLFFFFNDTATTEIYTYGHTLSLHDALPICDTPPSAPAAESGGAAERGDRQRPRRQIDVSPYLEVGQVLTADLKNGGDVLTYTTVAAGIDAAIVTRSPELAATLRYETRFGWTGDQWHSKTISARPAGPP